MTNPTNEESWDALSEYYQAEICISLDDVHYGPYGPGEKELGVIGGVQDLDVLELGCGGGQNIIVLKKWGARTAVGFDNSESQLNYARKLAESQNVDVRFIKGNMEDLSDFSDSTFDLVVSSHAMNYVNDIQAVFNESSRVMRTGGRIVVCLTHPIWNVVADALEGRALCELKNYFMLERESWDWTDYNGNNLASFESTPWRLDQIINGLIKPGLTIELVREPRGYTITEMEAIGFDNVPYYEQRQFDARFVESNLVVPNSLIVSAKKE
ncbi:MAG: class I SAM-dependent methyltransferase [Candidatus Thorarchaeota archaeon]|jgi:SAM-dependent methyltransferase